MSELLGELKLEGARRRIGSFCIEASFSLRAGERAALLAASGMGKTSLLRVIAGFDLLESGRILLNGKDVSELPPSKRGIGIVLQEQALFPSLNVLENAAFGLRVRGMSLKQRQNAVMPWLEKLGIEQLASSSVGRLSGGERQRVAIVRAVAWGPQLLLMDEPFSALDRTMRAVLLQELVGLHEHLKIPALLVTHDEADAAQFATARLEFQVNGETRRVLRK